MKRYCLLAFLVFSFIAGFAQSISVKSFQALPTDMTASSLEGKRIDQNGDVAALIKVMTTEKGFVFEGGSLGIVDTQQRVGEIWVWVPRGLRKITILHQQLGGLRDYRFPIEIEAERTYEMVLTTAKIETIVKEEVREQYLAFQIVPANATLEVDDKIWLVEPDGSSQNYVKFGTYSYRVQAPNYHTEAGRVTVDDPNNAKIVTVTLNPNFGWIEVAGNEPLKDGIVYVDNVQIGRAPCRSDALKSGSHTVTIVKKMYDTYSETVTVRDNETTRINPVLKADYAELTLKVDSDAEIWVNDEKKGIRTWTGPLGRGTYKIECKQAGHETSLTTKEITPAMNGQTLTLTAPTPITGSLMVESTPNFCQLYVDGKDMGTTPKSLNEMLIGQHTLKLTKDGYADYTETVTITKGERKQVKAMLSNGKEVQFTCNVPDAKLEIDGKVVGEASGTQMLSYGSHSLRATAADYRDYTGIIQVSESSQTFTISMESILEDEIIVTVNGVSFTMKLVEGGTFRMGSYDIFVPGDKLGAHSVTLSDYYMGETEVTQELWQTVMGSNPSKWKGDNLPVEQISWNDIQEFIRKLNQKTGRNFRMPTEAEWEYAAGGGKKSSGYKYAGSNTISSVAWYTDNSGSKTHSVKTKSPNELGLYDMSGNVCEWCQDWYGYFGYYGIGSQHNPTGPSSGSARVVRGGSLHDTRACRVSYRRSSDPDHRDFDCGFRLCLPQ